MDNIFSIHLFSILTDKWTQNLAYTGLIVYIDWCIGPVMSNILWWNHNRDSKVCSKTYYGVECAVDTTQTKFAVYYSQN
jgi:hypothetical protein